ncbi:hypothetical protein H5410_001647 [Solanum commersonii]|uniref:Uncharacterized protein n=1 Tax=Solanum commersonii TaxID=4109 RepID=A0A9J6B064_SOLCO|nr:hypothetical protein H5410_001647 [Solanum commersonii]
MILQASIASIKHNTRILICNQLDKIQRLINEKMWSVHHIISTDVFKEDRKEVVEETWRNTILQPFLDIVKRFLKNDEYSIIIECTRTIIISIFLYRTTVIYTILACKNIVIYRANI